MFYSHEVLTSRKYGVATVWLVATLGSKTSLKKVSRKAILEVNITKTCQTIAEPTVPMALRLQSSLLFGVTRVYSQQCGYVLADVESARNDMRALAKALRTSALTVGSGHKRRPEQLMLDDDPNFMPEVDLNFADLDIFDNVEQDLEHDSVATLMLPSTRDCQVTSASLEDGIGLEIPTLRSLSVPRSLVSEQFQRSANRYKSVYTGSTPHDRSHFAEYEGLQDDLDLDIEGNGNYGLIGSTHESPLSHYEAVIRNDMSDPAASAFDKNHQDIEMQDIDKAPVVAEMGVSLSISAKNDSMHDGSIHAITVTSSAASAPLRRHNPPAKKALSMDCATQLLTKDLKEWAMNYLELMEKQRKHKSVALVRSLAKDNARFWFYGATASFDPVADFRSAALLRAMDSAPIITSPKRARDDDAATDSGRRVRSRQASEMFDQVFEDEVFMPEYTEVEIGREQPTPLQDVRQSAMLPWSQSTVSRRPTSLLASSSVGAGARQPSLQPRASQRLLIASPLAQPGTQRAVSVPLTASLESDAAALYEDDFETYGPAGQVNTQTAAESQWLSSTLEDESMNFLAFVAGAVNTSQDNPKSAPHGGSIGFLELLPPTQHTAIVAAQGFLHVLTLNTRALLSATQIEPTDDIELRIVSHDHNPAQSSTAESSTSS